MEANDCLVILGQTNCIRDPPKIFPVAMPYLMRIRSSHLRKLALTIVSAPPPARLARNAGEGRDDARACVHGSAETSGHLRTAAAPPTVVDWNLQNAQTRSGGAHLHFDIPSIGQLAHPELEQRLAPDRPQGAHIRIAHPVKKPHAPAGQATGGELMPGDASPLALAARARSNHEIAAAGADRLDQRGDGSAR